MTRYSTKRRTFSFIGSLLTTISILALATNPAIAQDEKLPTGESLIQKYIERTGGQAAYDKINNRYFEAEIDIVNAGIVLNVKTYAAKPNKLIATVEANAIGKIQKGCTGTVAWSMSDMQGPVIEEGAALENQLRDSMFDRFVYWKEAYQSAECVAIEKVDDKDCYKVVLTPNPYKSEEAKDEEVSLLTAFFDKDTNLATKLESNLVTQAGTIDVTAWLSDYKTVDGIKFPHTTKLELVGQTRIMKITSLKHDVKLADNQFDPPAEIKALLKKKAAKKNGNKQVIIHSGRNAYNSTCNAIGVIHEQDRITPPKRQTQIGWRSHRTFVALRVLRT
jgi:hypothetical protein